MLKRLIEVALPLKEVSEHASHEKVIRRGNISTLHIWWARRPLAACRAVIFASLIPDPDDPECPEEFRALVTQTFSRSEFKPKHGNGSAAEDTPRNRCLEFIKHLVKWENSNNSAYIEPAQKLIAAAHKFLCPEKADSAPKIVDPFAGGGAIPLESLRLGCDGHAIDLNPVAHLIELCTLVFPQKYGQADSRPVPEYITRLAAHNRLRRQAKGGPRLFGDDDTDVAIEADEFSPQVEITEEEYRRNPLVADVKYWGHWVLEKARSQLTRYYPSRGDGSLPVDYLWTRSVECSNPTCKLRIPLITQFWICRKSKRRIALRITPNEASGSCRFSLAEGADIDFDPSAGTVYQGKARCPACHQVSASSYLRNESQAGRIHHDLMVVVSVEPGRNGKHYRIADVEDADAYKQAQAALAEFTTLHGPDVLPTEEISRNAPRRVSPPLYGLTQFIHLFNDRQLLALSTLASLINDADEAIAEFFSEDYSHVIVTYLAMCLDQCLPFTSSLNRWKPDAEAIVDVFGRQAIPMVWDYCENNPLGTHGGTWHFRLDRFMQPVSGVCNIDRHGHAVRSSATSLPFEERTVAAVVTDPPYYDSVPYSDLSDFFYVWLKRTVGSIYPDVFRTPLTPKSQEITEQRPHSLLKKRRDREAYQQMMEQAFSEMWRVLADQSVACVMFAHKSTSAWEALIEGLNNSKLSVTASWPIDTEMSTRMVARNTASLASSVTLVCRKRTEDAGDGLWDDVRQELKEVAKERLDFFWDQGIRGADFFISAIGPALSVYGRYARVIRLSGEEVTVGEFLDEVRSLVTSYALAKILHTTNTANIDSESRFYVVWKWSYGDAKVPADESFKLAQALGIDTEEMWDKTGVLTKSGENVQCSPVEKRMKIKDLGEPDADGTSASLIDVLHRMCVFRDKGDSAGMAQFLGQSGQARNPALWLVAQAISETLPDGNKEKQLMQGLLNQQEGLDEATRQKEFDLKG